MMVNMIQKAHNKFIYESCSAEEGTKKELFEVSIWFLLMQISEQKFCNCLRA